MKKFAAILLAVLMLMLSCSALADSSWSGVEVYRSEFGEWVEMPADQYLTVDDFGTASDYDFYYDSETGVLTLNTVELDGAIRCEHELTIELIGSNSINHVIDEEFLEYGDFMTMALFVNDDLTITGSGRLNISVRADVKDNDMEPGGDMTLKGIRTPLSGVACYDLSMQSGYVNVNVGDSDFMSAGMQVNGYLEVHEDATLVARSGDAGIASVGIQSWSVWVDGGKLSAHSGKAQLTCGLVSVNPIGVESGSLYATSGDAVDSQLTTEDVLTAALMVQDNTRPLSLMGTGESANLVGLYLGSGLKLFAGQKLNSPLVDGEMIDYRSADCAAELGADVPAQRALINTTADVPATGDMSNPALWLAMVGAALIVLVSMKKRAFAR